MYQDTEKGAIRALKELSCYEIEEAQAIPDPQAAGVWLVFARLLQESIAAIVYLKEEDFEEVDFEEAKIKYGKEITI